MSVRAEAAVADVVVNSPDASTAVLRPMRSPARFPVSLAERFPVRSQLATGRGSRDPGDQFQAHRATCPKGAAAP